ncbi:unnamed protein product [Phytophthora fragariaefolia]|uniref:Unnamed protein product n=1 Tax=Phytophthora fragariaefolia TaxID=1490495 RepID=A0A9W7CJH9_9STRA|nr:unnamed protein product [Phytophthora fragariaefolia]
MDKVRKHAFWHGWKRDVAEYVLSARLDSTTIIETMVNEVISRHGLPERLLSDQGSNFISELARSFYETLGIKKLFGAAYHPQTQALVERFNGMLLGMIKLFVNETQTDWDIYLSACCSPTEPPTMRPSAILLASYRRRLFLSLRDTRRMVERQLIKAQCRHARRLEGQTDTKFEVGDPVRVYQYFRARRGEKKTKELAFSWHGPYRVVGTVGENAYRVAIPTHPNRVVTANVKRLKRFQGRWSRPYPSEVPSGVDSEPGVDDNGPLTEGDLPSTSFVERLVIGGEEAAFSGTNCPVIDIIAKRKRKGVEQYMVLMATYEVSWRATATLLPAYRALIREFEDTQRKDLGLPELRRSARLAEADAAVDEDELLF